MFRARLFGLSSVKRRVALRGDHTLADLHLALQDAFEWDNEHLYAFWLDGRFWSLREPLSQMSSRISKTTRATA